PPAQGRELFRFARDYLPGLPDQCGTFLAGLNAPPEPFVPEQYRLAPMYAVAVVGFGDEAAHAELVQPIRDALAPAFEVVTSMPCTALQQLFDASAPWGVLGYEKAVYLEQLTDGAIDVILEHQPRKQSPLSFLPIFVLGGAFHRADDAATA